jgi:hypothetical protein
MPVIAAAPEPENMIHESFEYTLEDRLKRLCEARAAIVLLVCLFGMLVSGIQAGRTTAAFATRTQLWQCEELIPAVHYGSFERVVENQVS